MNSIEDVPALGVGIVYFSEFQQLRSVIDPTTYDVLETEPQTFWAIDPRGNLAVNSPKLGDLAGLRCANLAHSVGLSVGNARAPSAQSLDLLAQNVRLLKAPYVSEHLSYNLVATSEGGQWTGFLLPPPQTLDGVAVAVEQVRLLRSALQVPVAFETGVNYFPPDASQLDDGEFFSLVAEHADCGILLDLHNLLANERNGRATVDHVLKALPLDRVWEVHVAGGHTHRGFYLDAHDGLVSAELRKLTEEVVPRLPNLRALVFEAQPDSLRGVTRAAHDEQQVWLRNVWDTRGRRARRAGSRRRIDSLPNVSDAKTRVGVWERQMFDRIGSTAMAQRRDAQSRVHSLLRELIGEARGGMLMRSVPLVTRLLLCTLGKPAFRGLLERYFAHQTPSMFPIEEGTRFLSYVELEAADVPYLSELLAFERSVLTVVATQTARRSYFPYNPAELLDALERRTQPHVQDGEPYEVEITPRRVTLHKITA